MTRRTVRQVGVVLVLMTSVPAATRAQAPAHGTNSAPTAVVAVAPATSPAVDAYRWRGHEAEIEEFLRTAPISHFKDIPIGITKPRRGYFAPGGLASSIAWKPLGEQMMNGKKESHRSEIAAYLLSRHLGLDMVPPVVEREIGGVKGAAVYWIDGVKSWDPKAPPRMPGATWARQTSRMFMFDQLVANIDRNQGNLLYDDAGHIFLIDHSRAFTSKPNLAGLKPPQQFDRGLWMRMAALTRPELDTLLRPWLSAMQIETILKRRDEMQRQIDKQVRAQGEASTFLPEPVAAAAPSPD